MFVGTDLHRRALLLLYSSIGLILDEERDTDKVASYVSCIQLAASSVQVQVGVWCVCLCVRVFEAQLCLLFGALASV